MDLTQQILTDRETFPDDRTIDLGNGQVVTVKQFRDALMPKSEMTRMSTEWSRKERQLAEAFQGSQQQLTMLQQQAAGLQQQLEAAAAARGADPGQVRNGEIDEDELARDPVLGPIVKRLQTATKLAEEAHEKLSQQQKRLESHEQTWTRANYQAQINNLRAMPEAKDVDFNAFLSYAQRRPVIDTENNGVDLASTFKVFAFDNLVGQREKAAEERGIEKGRAAASVPRVPIGRRRAPRRPEGLPANLQSLDTETVLNDPEMQEAMRADGLV